MDMSETAFRAINTQILNVVGQPPPLTVLATLTALADGLEDVEVAPDVEWGDGFTRWKVIGVTPDTLLYVEASKRVSDWYGGGHADQDDETVKCSGSIWPLSQVTGLALTSKRVSSDGRGGQQVFGTWSVGLPHGTVEIDTASRKYADARDKLVRTLRSYWHEKAIAERSE